MDAVATWHCLPVVDSHRANGVALYLLEANGAVITNERHCVTGEPDEVPEQVAGVVVNVYVALVGKAFNSCAVVRRAAFSG